jgi:hypothetical protein
MSEPCGTALLDEEEEKEEEYDSKTFIPSGWVDLARRTRIDPAIP